MADRMVQQMRVTAAWLQCKGCSEYFPRAEFSTIKKHGKRMSSAICQRCEAKLEKEKLTQKMAMLNNRIERIDAQRKIYKEKLRRERETAEKICG